MLVPRSRCRTRTAILASQITKIGPNSRPLGIRIPRTFLPTTARESLRFTRYPAKKIISAIFAISPGWSVIPKKETQRVAPLMVVPINGTRGRSSKATPIAIETYTYLRKNSWLGTYKITIAAIAIASDVHITCLNANSSAPPEAIVARSRR